MDQDQTDPVIAEIRETRGRISTSVDHDPDRLVAYYMGLQERHRDRFIEAPKSTGPFADETSGREDDRAREVIAHFEHQSEDEQLAEIEAAREAEGVTLMAVPTGLVPDVRALLASKQGRESFKPNQTTSVR